MRYSTLRFVSFLLILAMAEQSYSAPLRSPLQRVKGPQAPAVQEASETDLEKDREAEAELRLEAANALRAQSVSFEPNVGQFPEEVRFAAQGVASGVYLSSNAMAISVPLPSETAATPPMPGEPLAPAASAYHSIRMEVAGGRADAAAEAIDPTGRTSNYYRGDEKFEAIGHVAQVRFDDVYPAIDLVYHGQGGELEYDFVLEPGADPSVPAVRFSGVDALRVDDAGDLLLATPAGELRQSRPIAFQDVDGERVEVAAAFDRREDGTIGFEVGDYDASLPLTIDPKIYYATGFGGPGDDFPARVVVDENDDIYVIGQTRMPSWPGLPELDSDGEFVGFVLRLAQQITESGPNTWDLAATTFLGDATGSTQLNDLDYHDGALYVIGSSTAQLPETDQPVSQLTRGERAVLLVLVAATLAITLLRAYGNDSVGSAVRVIVPGGNALPFLALGIVFYGATFLGQPRGMGLDALALLTVALATGALLSIVGTYMTRSGANLGITGLDWILVAGAISIIVYGASNGQITNALGSFLGGWEGFVAVATVTLLGVLALTAVHHVGGSGDEFISGAKLVLAAGVLSVMLLMISSSGLLFGLRSLAPTNGFNVYLALFVLATFALTSAWAIVGAGDIFGAGMALDRWGNFYCGLQVSSAVRTASLISADGTLETFRFLEGGGSSSSADNFNAGVIKLSINFATLAVFVYFAVIVRTIANMFPTWITYENWENPILIGRMRGSQFPTTEGAISTSNLGGYDGFVLMLKKPVVLGSAILGSAGFQSGPLSPCEIVTVFGHWIGPKALAVPGLDDDNEFALEAGGASVLLNGVAQRLIFASKEQLAYIMDCGKNWEGGGSQQASGVELMVEFNGQQSNPVMIEIEDTDPALFTVAQSGQGKVAAINQDGTLNSPQNPAPVGSTVALFGTGGGVTNPFCDSAGLASLTELQPTAASFASTVGGQEATVIFSGVSPGLTCGLNQWNVTIAEGVTAADANTDSTATTLCVETADGTVIEAPVTIEAQ